MKEFLGLVFTGVLVLYLSTPLIVGLWMKAAWRWRPRVAFGVGIAPLLVWVASFVWLVIYIHSGYWYTEHASEQENLEALLWMIGLSVVIIVTNASFIYGIKRLHRAG